MKITSEDWESSPEHHAEVIAWAKANNLVPENIAAQPGPAVPALVIQNGHIHWYEFVRSPEGRTQIDPIDPNEVLVRARVSPLLVPYPERKIGA